MKDFATELFNRLKNNTRIAGFYENMEVEGEDPWNLSIELDWNQVGRLRIGSFTVSDIWALKYWWRHSLSYENRRFNPLFPCDERLTHYLANHYKNHERRRDITFNAWLLKEEHLEFDNEIIGHFYVVSWDSSKPSIGLSVSDDYQRKALGTLFFSIGVATLQLMGKRELWLTTDLDNEKGYNLYVKLGFQRTGEADVFLPADGYKRKEQEMKLDMDTFR